MGESYPCFYYQKLRNNRKNSIQLRLSNPSKEEDAKNDENKRNSKSYGKNRENNSIKISIKKTNKKKIKTTKVDTSHISIVTDVVKKMSSELIERKKIKYEINKNEEVNDENKNEIIKRQKSSSPIKRTNLLNNEINSNNKKFIKGQLKEQNKFCKIYSGLSITTGEIVAIKEYTNLSAERKNLIIKQKNKLYKLKHPNIIKISKIISLPSNYNSELSIVFESANLDSFEYLIGKYGIFEEKIIQKYGKQLLLGLQYLHNNNIYHKNLKLKNILVDTDGSIKIDDYLIDGIILGNEKEIYNYFLKEVTIEYYIPPFFIKNINNINDKEIVDNNNNKFWQAYDLWFVGCIFIECITGKKPWSHYNFKNNSEFFEFLNTTNLIPTFPQKISVEFNELLLTLLNPTLTKKDNIYDIIFNLNFFTKNSNNFTYNNAFAGISNSVKKSMSENNDTNTISNESGSQLGQILANNKVVNILNSTNNPLFSVTISNEDSSLTGSFTGNNLYTSTLSTKKNEFKNIVEMNVNRIKSMKTEMPVVKELQNEKSFDAKSII